MGTAPHYSWVEATHVSVNTLTPKSSRRVLAPRPSRWQQGALPLSYYCLEAPAGVSPASPGLQPGTCILGHGARAAEEGLEPPTTVVNGHPLSRLSYSAKARTGSRHAPGGSHAGFPCVLSTAGRCLQDGPGCATPAASDPYRTRTCVRCLRGSRPTARRTGRELVRKVEVSNPHGRTVSLFSNRVPPANEAYLPGRSGSGSNAGEVALGLRLASEHLPTRSTLQMHRVDSSSPDSAPGSIRTSILRLRRPLRVQSRHGGNEDRNDLGPRATTRTRPEDLSRTKAALFPLSYGGVASSTGLEPVASAFGGQRSCPTELRRDGTPARTRTRNWRFVVSRDRPFHHQGLAPQAGFDPAASAVTRRRSPD